MQRVRREDALNDSNSKETSRPFLRLNFATLWVRDQERTRQFFVERLGFRVIVDIHAPDLGRWIVVTPPPPEWLSVLAGGGLVGMAIVVPAEGSAEQRRIGQNTGLSFLTEDIGAVYEEWSKQGVRFALPPREPEWGSGQARFALFEDPDGNKFSLIEFDEATRAVETERRAQAARLDAERQAAHDAAIARQVQMRLLPQHKPTLRTLTYAGACYPARAVGGDYYDFLDLGEGKLGLLLGDIAGKGMAAALLMANLQANLRGQSATAREKPQGFIRSVNQSLYENTAQSDYATLFYAEYDDRSRLLRYANCGHPPAVLLRNDGTLVKLGATATVIGLFENWECEIEERQLSPGDTLVLYTDGITEAFDGAGEEFGEDRLLETLRQHRDCSKEELIQAVVERVHEFSPQEQADDITLIVAKCV